MEQKHSLKDWFLATRPWSFPASVMPVLVSVFWLWSEGCDISWLYALLAIVNIVLVHAAGNVWSDIADYRSGVDAIDVYGVRLLVDGVFSERQFRRLSLGLNALAVALGLVLVALTGLPLLLIGALGLCLSLGYPFLKYHALGDADIILCYAVLPMLGTSFIVTGDIRPDVLWIAVPVGLITVAILHTNNVRDIETDARAGIATFAQLTGRRLGALIYAGEVLVPFLWLAVLTVTGVAPVGALLAVLAFPVAVGNARAMMTWRQGTEGYADLDQKTAKLQLLFSLLLIVGLTLSRLL